MKMIEFIESYIVTGDNSPSYQWSDNHGTLTRCKDCKHYEDYGYGRGMCGIYAIHEPIDNDYCSRAERREDGQG